ncbi:anti-sigma factor family protein [Salinisphaera hydrothermalis]|uniref:anti-sigma factor family protein n=1 Tax=Salinisphaera hydrothermalis TaxID=563188 RepID=UPI00333F33DA
MRSKNRATIDYEQCVAYYRAGRRIAGAAAIERYLTANPRTAERAERDAQHDLALAHRYDPVLNEPIPPRLLHGHDSSPASWLAGAGLVAMIGLSAAGGWWLRGLEFGAASPTAQTNTFGQQVARLSDRQPAVDATARVAARPTPPDLSRAGYRFSGRRVVPTAGGQPLTAYDYRNNAGKHVTIYARPEPGAGRRTPDVVSPSGVSLARWQAHGHDYALTGDLPPATLNELAEIAAQPTSQDPADQQTPAAPSVKMPQQTQAPAATVGQPVERTVTPRQQPASGL